MILPIYPIRYMITFSPRPILVNATNAVPEVGNELVHEHSSIYFIFFRPDNPRLLALNCYRGVFTRTFTFVFFGPGDTIGTIMSESCLGVVLEIISLQIDPLVGMGCMVFCEICPHFWD